MSITLTKTRAQNILLSSTGVYYFRARLGGKQVTRSLNTSDFAQARIRAASVREEETKTAIARKASGFSRVLPWGDCVQIWLKRQENRKAEIRKNTVRYWQYISRDVLSAIPLKTFPSAINYDLLLSWWGRFAPTVAASRANNALCAVRTVLALQVEKGMRFDNPAQNLKRVAKTKKELILPTREDFQKIITHVREQAAVKYPGDYQGPRLSPSADFLEFLAYSGCRVAEAQGVNWQDVARDTIRIREGKGGKSRRVDITPDMRGLLNRLKGQFEGFQVLGSVFRVKAPRAALSGACRRLSLPHLRLHDLRHFFATNAIESGVDIATVAKWLGHADGGVLALSVYGHVRDDHSLASAARVRRMADCALQSPSPSGEHLNTGVRRATPDIIRTSGFSPAPLPCVRDSAGAPPRENRQGIFYSVPLSAVFGAGGSGDICSFEIMSAGNRSFSSSDRSFS